MTVEEIEQWIEANKFNGEFDAESLKGSAPEEWLAQVHAGKLLSGLFQSLSSTRYGYNKIEHGLALTRHILDHSPTGFTEVAEKIEALIGA